MMQKIVYIVEFGNLYLLNKLLTMFRKLDALKIQYGFQFATQCNIE